MKRRRREERAPEEVCVESQVRQEASLDVTCNPRVAHALQVDQDRVIRRWVQLASLPLCIRTPLI